MRRRALLCLLPLAACQQAPDETAAPEEAAAAEAASPAPKPAEQATPMFAAGQWEATTVVTAVDMAGLPPDVAERMVGRETSYSHCVTPEEASRSPGDLFRKSAEGSCTYDSFEMDGGAIDAVMQCAGGDQGGTSTVEMSGDYSRDSYRMEMKMTVAAPSMPQAMVMEATTSGRRTGDCAPQGAGQ